MKIQLRQNVLHEGARHLAGAVLEVSEDIGARLTSAGIAEAIPAPVVPTEPPAPASTPVQAVPPVEKTPEKAAAGKKPARKSRAKK